ncbi:hypothetical protein D3C81_1388760 [compost metagenome]
MFRLAADRQRSVRIEIELVGILVIAERVREVAKVIVVKLRILLLDVRQRPSAHVHHADIPFGEKIDSSVVIHAKLILVTQLIQFERVFHRRFYGRIIGEFCFAGFDLLEEVRLADQRRIAWHIAGIPHGQRPGILPPQGERRFAGGFDFLRGGDHCVPGFGYLKAQVAENFLVVEHGDRVGVQRHDVIFPVGCLAFHHILVEVA